MTIYEAMNERHSVRKYTDRPIEAEKIAALRHRYIIVISDYNMVEHPDTDRAKGINYNLCYFSVYRARKRYTAWVIMTKNNACSFMFNNQLNDISCRDAYRMCITLGNKVKR